MVIGEDILWQTNLMPICRIFFGIIFIASSSPQFSFYFFPLPLLVLNVYSIFLREACLLSSLNISPPPPTDTRIGITEIHGLKVRGAQ